MWRINFIFLFSIFSLSRDVLYNIFQKFVKKTLLLNLLITKTDSNTIFSTLLKLSERKTKHTSLVEEKIRMSVILLERRKGVISIV